MNSLGITAKFNEKHKKLPIKELSISPPSSPLNRIISTYKIIII